MSVTQTGTLFIVATPIGNLEDITLRALRILQEVSVVFAEDTRVTKKLFTHYDIQTSLTSLNARTEKDTVRAVLKHLTEGESVAYVSDAGTPTISDPGAMLVAAAHEAGHAVVAIPGASAVTAALSIAGVPASTFLFLGFLPHKKGRETLFKEMSASKRTVIFYESPHRILKTLEKLSEHLDAHKKVVIARELTKLHEQVVSGSAQEVSEYFEKHPDKVKGEFVVIVA